MFSGKVDRVDVSTKLAMRDVEKVRQVLKERMQDDEKKKKEKTT
jgi:hypothetical protein